MILDELLSNVLHYGGRLPKPVSLVLGFDSGNRAAYGFIRDYGTAFDPLTDAPERKEGQIGGMGITISKFLATTLSYKRVGSSNVLSFTKKKSK